MDKDQALIEAKAVELANVAEASQRRAGAPGRVYESTEQMWPKQQRKAWLAVAEHVLYGSSEVTA